MVRRRGVYEVKIIGKQLICMQCGEKTFRHREVYLDLESHTEKNPAQLTLQSLTCEYCSTSQLVQEKVKGLESNIVYNEVKSTW